VILPVLEVALTWPRRECQYNDGIVTIVVPTFWKEMETTREEEDEVVADGIRKVRALELSVRGCQGRGSAGSQTDCAVSKNGDDDLRDKKSNEGDIEDLPGCVEFTSSK